MNNLAVITTKFVLENNSPIVSVFKDIEGDWQFFGPEENISEDEARVISLEEILQIDSSINEILTMENENHAWRTGIDDHWKIEQYKE